MSLSHRRTRSIVTGLALAACAVLLAPATAAAAAPPDRVPPTAPTNLRVQGVTHTWVSLAWSPSTDNSGTVFYDATLQSPGGQLKERAFGPAQGFGGLTPGVTFTASVRAVDLAGNASAAVSVQVTTPARTLPPPTTPTNLRPVLANGVLNAIAWDPSTHATGVSYLLLLGDSAISVSSFTSVSLFQLIHIDCAVEPGGTYTLTVQALSADNDFSARSAPLTVTIPNR